MIRDRIAIINELRQWLFRTHFNHLIGLRIKLHKLHARHQQDEASFWERDAARLRAEGEEEEVSDRVVKNANNTIENAKMAVQQLLDLRRGDLRMDEVPGFDFGLPILIDPSWDRSDAGDIDENIRQFQEQMLNHFHVDTEADEP